MIELPNTDVKEIELQVDGQAVHFVIKPENYTDIARLIAWSKEIGLEFDQIGNFLGTQFLIISRIVNWKGISLTDGKEAPCSMEAKLAFFGKYPEIATEIIKKLDEIEKAEIKNSKTSQDG